MIVVFFNLSDYHETPNYPMWKDARVIEWIGKHAKVLALHCSSILAADREWDVYPRAVVALRGGKEIDRDTHFRSADELLEWLQQVNTGTVTADFAVKRGGERTERPVQVQNHVVLARRHRLAGRLKEAAEELEWLWRHPMSDAWSIHSVKAEQESYELMRVDEAAKPRFIALRDELGRACLAGAPEQSTLTSWLALQGLLPDATSFNQWLDAKPGPNETSAQRFHAWENVFVSLCGQEKWTDAASLITNPETAVGRAFLRSAGLKALGAPSSNKSLNGYQRQGCVICGLMYAALLSADREKEALALIELMCSQVEEPGDGKAIAIAFALSAKQPREHQLAWAEVWDAANPAEKALRPQVDTALKNKSQ